MRALLLLLLVPVSSIVLWTGCADDEMIVQPAGTVRVIGNVFAYICDESYPANDDLDHRHMVETGRTAYVTFTRIDGEQAWDDTYTYPPSQFQLYVAPGLWRATVFTDHTVPDVFDSLEITGDTVLTLNLRYDFEDPDTVVIAFEFPLDGPGIIIDPDSPTFPEWIDTLNLELGRKLVVTHSHHWMDSSVAQNRLWFLYSVPIAVDARVWEIFAMLGNYRFESDLPDKYPDNMSISSRTYGLCPGDFKIEIDSTMVDSGHGTYEPPE